MKNDIYAQVVGCLEEQLGDETLLFNPATGAATQLNSSSAQVWCLCDGSRAVQQIIDELSAAFPDAGSELAHDVCSAIALLHGEGLLELVNT